MINMTGQKIGKLTVIERDIARKSGAAYWICKCDCGNTISVRGNNLRDKNHPTQSCGCLNKENRKIDTDSLVGKVFNRLQVIERDLKKPVGHGHTSYWICKCICGNIISVSHQNLVTGKTQSCGCYRKDINTQRNTLDLTNKQYGNVVALFNTGELSTHHSYLWQCYCKNCDSYFITSAEYLQSGHINSCGCTNIQSRGELYIKNILDSNEIKYKTQFTFKDCRNPKTNYLYKFDFAIFNNENILQYLIEFDGEQHFIKKKNSIFDYEAISFNDNYKNQYCLTNNIPLIRIPYWELKNLDLDILFSDKYLIKEGE